MQSLISPRQEGGRERSRTEQSTEGWSRRRWGMEPPRLGDAGSPNSLSSLFLPHSLPRGLFSQSTPQAISPARACCCAYRLVWRRILTVTGLNRPQDDIATPQDAISTPQANSIAWVDATAARGATTLYHRYGEKITTY